MTQKRTELKRQLKKIFEEKRAAGIKPADAVEAVMETPVKVKDLFTEDTIIQFLFNKSYGLGSDRQRQAQQDMRRIEKQKR